MAKMPNEKRRNRVPEELIKAIALRNLLCHYEQNPDFLRERESIREQNSPLLLEILGYCTELVGKATLPISARKYEQLRGQVKACIQGQPQFNRWIHQYLDFCRRWHLDYPWAMVFLLFDDIGRVEGETKGTDTAIRSLLFTAITGIPLSIRVEIPSFAVYLWQQDGIHKFMDDFLDSLEKPHNQTDIRRGLALHTRWFYEYNILKKAPEEIFNDPKLNPQKRANAEQIRQAISDLNTLLSELSHPGGKAKSMALF